MASLQSLKLKPRRCAAAQLQQPAEVVFDAAGIATTSIATTGIAALLVAGGASIASIFGSGPAGIASLLRALTTVAELCGASEPRWLRRLRTAAAVANQSAHRARPRSFARRRQSRGRFQRRGLQRRRAASRWQWRRRGLRRRAA